MLRQWIRTLLCGVVIVPAASLFADSIVRCESKGGRPICQVDDIGNVVLFKQRRLSVCTEGESWGYTRDAIWVDHGCRADFQVLARRADRDRDSRLICESSGVCQFLSRGMHWLDPGAC